MCNWDGGTGWWMLWGGIMMLLFWGGIIALAVWSVQALTRGSTGRGDAERTRATPIEIAQERYAKGEITREEFEQMKKDLAS